MVVALAESVVPPATPHVAQHQPEPAWQATHPRTIVLAGVTVLVLVALAFPRYPPAHGTASGAGGSPPVALATAPVAAPVAPSAPSLSRAVSAPSSTIVGPTRDRHRVVESTKASATIAPLIPATEVPVHEDAAKSAADSEVIPEPAPASVSAGGGGSTTPVTITGCLEISVKQDEFRLTDTEGLDAPRSRSWRTGFLKKRSAAVALVEPSDGLALQTHVGRRVAATGMLTSHDLKVSALRVVGACD
jgi:hypothetical protein